MSIYNTATENLCVSSQGMKLNTFWEPTCVCKAKNRKQSQTENHLEPGT